MDVLVAMDDSDPAWKALEYALSTFPDADVTVLHVVDPVTVMYGDMEGGYYDEAMYDAAIEQGEALLERVAERAAEDGREDVETVLETGRPAHSVVEYVHEHDVDQVVIGSHGRSGVSRVLLGSVAELVARRADAPVTIVR